eukprot:GFYU01013173.1.p1 GENE.GFYU01013173.1~~GFYU01013173.1.p1  ORF type:complete len:206 (-),score=68.76 GFYU01013173.1:21-638(-)
MSVSRTFARICVFCGSKEGKNPAYLNAAVTLGEEMAKRGIGLVYGGGNVGLMGAVSQAVHKGGATVKGILPHSLAPRELSGEGVGEQILVDTLHTRKAMMAENSEAFIALPGGLGTLEELFEVLTWCQLGLHDKPIGVLNADGYWTPTVNMIDHMVKEGFVSESHRECLVVADTASELLDKLSTHVLPESVIASYEKKQGAELLK